MEKHLVIVRHGDYGYGYDDEPLSKFGLEQMKKLREVINIFVEKAKVTGEEIPSVFLSFSSLNRAFQSIRELYWDGYGYEIVVINEGYASRSDIREPQKILDRVMGIANRYNADLIVIVAHGDMPSVIAETAHEFVTGKKLGETLSHPGKACGFIVNMATGEITSIGYDSLDEKKPLHPVVQETSRPVIRGGPPRINGPVKKGGPSDIDDDIPF